MTTRLIPNVERRLNAWIAVQDRLARKPRRETHPTITISRQFGCEGYPLAEQLKAQLDARTGASWTIFDKALIERVSRETHLSERLLGSLGGHSQVLDNLANLIPGWHTHSEAYELLARYILRIARDGNAIIVGRGGAVVAQRLSNCFHFRLEAPLEYRLASIQQRLGLGPDEAKATVIEQQRVRDHFIERFLHCTMADTRHYHAVFNMEKDPIDRIAASLLALIPPALLGAARPGAHAALDAALGE